MRADTLPSHQASLLDLLRMLRQRRRADAGAQAFVVDNLKLAASNVMQAGPGFRGRGSGFRNQGLGGGGAAFLCHACL